MEYQSYNFGPVELFTKLKPLTPRSIRRLPKSMSEQITTLSTSGKQALDEFIKESEKKGNVPGFVFGISNLEREIYFQGAGNNVVTDPTSRLVNPDSVFWICSQTKLIVALAALKLIDSGMIALDTAVGDYLPEFRNPIVVDRTSTQKTAFRPAKAVVTVKHLLNSSSGLFYPVMVEDMLGMHEGYKSKDMHQAADPVAQFFRIVIGELPALPLKFEPGTDFVYGWNSDALGFLVEKVSGMSLEEFCKQHIFTPLGIQASFYLTPDLRERLVDLAFRDQEGNLIPCADRVEIIEQDEKKVRLHLGGIGIYTSMRDYLTLLRHIMQLNAGWEVPNPILQPETVRSIFVPALTEIGSKSLSNFIMAEGTQWSSALALTTRDWPKQRKKGSAFWGGWAGTQYFMDVETGIAGVFGTQIVRRSFIDAQVDALRVKLEELTYAALQHSSGKL